MQRDVALDEPDEAALLDTMTCARAARVKQSRMLRYIALFACAVSCGGHVAQVDAGAPQAPACSIGAPAAVLVPEIDFYQFNGLATDGQRLYVAQGGGGPLVWSIDVRGGNRIDIYGNMTNGSVSSSTPTPMLAVSGGVYFDALDTNGDGLVWVSASGGLPKHIGSYAFAFDATGTRAFSGTSGGNATGEIDATTLADGTIHGVYALNGNDDIATVAATSSFVHVIIVDVSPNIHYTDRRVRVDGSGVQDEIATGFGNSQVFEGPNAICATSSDGNGLACLSDGDTQPRVFPIAAFPRFIDDKWIYAQAFADSAFVRISLGDGHVETITMQGYPSAVTAFGDCVYAVLITPPQDGGGPKGAVWRFAPGH